ncbi:MAG: putative small secreted protein [Francisella sp.]|jgi:predicted small secreted protein
MKKLKLITVGLTAALTLSACSTNSSMMDDLNSTGNSIARFANGTFSAQLYNTDVKSVYNATQLAINNTNNYSIESNTVIEKNAEIKGAVKTEKSILNKEGKTPYSIEIIKYDSSTVNIYIKIGTIGDKQSSVDLLSSIRTNLGL